jgi:hypothetical protein
VGLVSNQWLNSGAGKRWRSHSLAPINATVERRTDDWGKRNNVVLRVIARHFDCRYQEIYLSQKEVDAALETVVESCSERARRQLVALLLRRLNDAEVLQTIAHALQGRIKT